MSLVNCNLSWGQMPILLTHTHIHTHMHKNTSRKSRFLLPEKLYLILTIKCPHAYDNEIMNNNETICILSHRDKNICSLPRCLSLIYLCSHLPLSLALQCTSLATNNSHVVAVFSCLVHPLPSVSVGLTENWNASANRSSHSLHPCYSHEIHDHYIVSTG